ncbi:MAG: ABC transporter substrate-binding protein [Carbonactinosporaceae bacterium]
MTRVRHRHRFSAALAACTLAAVASACGGEAPTATGGGQGDGGADSLTLGLVVAKTFELTVPAQIAQEQGYFKDEGVDVEIVAFQGGADLVKGMASGAAQIGAATGFDPAAAAAKGVPMSAFAGVATESPMVVVAGAGSGVESTADLCGKKLGITRFGSLTDFAVRVVGRDEGCTITAVPLGAAPAQVAAMTQGEVDGFVWSTEVGIAMEQAGKGHIVARLPDVIDEDQYGIFMAQPEYLKANRETAEAFLRAVYRAVAWMKDDANREEAIDRTAKLLELEPAVAEKTFDELVAHLSDDGTMNAAGLEELAGNLPELEIARRVPELDEYYTDAFVPVRAGG